MSKTAMKLALDALEKGDLLCEVTAANILRQSLAEPEQPARVPLTIEKIEACMKRAYAAAAGSRNLEICFAREIEAAHGITAQHASVPFLPGEYENTLLKTEKARKQL